MFYLDKGAELYELQRRINEVIKSYKLQRINKVTKSYKLQRINEEIELYLKKVQAANKKIKACELQRRIRMKEDNDRAAYILVNIGLRIMLRIYRSWGRTNKKARKLKDDNICSHLEDSTYTDTGKQEFTKTLKKDLKGIQKCIAEDLKGIQRLIAEELEENKGQYQLKDKKAKVTTQSLRIKRIAKKDSGMDSGM